jgi:nitrate reductase molybdenum cofactor assembly chaperone
MVMAAAAEKIGETENSLYTIFADLFSYPKENFKERVQECIDALLDHPEYPGEAVEHLRAFQEKTKDMSLSDIEGFFSYTFEMTADYTLDMGHHLFEGFKRANSLVSMKNMYRAQGFPVDTLLKGELPDHLSVLLRFLDWITDDDELKADFRDGFVVKSLEKLDKNFEKNKDNIYWNLEKALYVVIHKDVNET